MTVAPIYSQGPDSALRRLDPRWKLAALIIFAAAVVPLHGLVPCLGALAGALFLAYLGRLPPVWFFARLGALGLVVGVFAAFLPLLPQGEGPPWVIGPVHVWPEGLEAAIRLCLKAPALMTLMLVLWGTSAPAANLKAAQALHVPGVFIQLTVLAYRYLFLLIEELGRLRLAMRVRGYRNRLSVHSYRTAGHVAGTLLVRSAERAERVGQAMRCRGFDGRFRCLVEMRTGAADIVFFLLTVGVGGGLLTWDLMLR
jgi:cobalt/nickel transport system permease protein